MAPQLPPTRIVLVSLGLHLALKGSFLALVHCPMGSAPPLLGIPLPPTSLNFLHMSPSWFEELGCQFGLLTDDIASSRHYGEHVKGEEIVEKSHSCHNSVIDTHVPRRLGTKGEILLHPISSL